MVKKLDKIISYLYYLLFFAVPLVLHTKTSELFEFNKMVFTYLITTLVVFVWLTKSIFLKKFIFKKTFLDIPILIFLSSQTISTFLSVDFRTSLLGYYSRFHGGLISSISYAALYWAFVANISAKDAVKAIKVMLTSALLVSIYAILQHFGIDKDVWVQDVQHRVFSTLGQPNWLAAWIVALIPITWALSLNSKLNNLRYWFWFTLSNIFFLTVLFTKSRSGLLGLAVAELLFWSTSFILTFKVFKEKSQSFIASFVIYHLSFIILALAIGTPWTPKLSDLMNQKGETKIVTSNVPAAPALEIGGSSSTEIRKIVWRGAIDIWKNYPVFGSGVETFAFSYYNFRPKEHNLVSEWDYLYNKAHNEYLNFLATTGTIGLTAYIILIISIILTFTKESGIMNYELWKKTTDHSLFLIPYSLFAGFVSILISNFFGFSVVPVALQFFLFPAIAVSLAQNAEHKEHSIEVSYAQKVLILFALCAMLYALFAISKYWYADYVYANGKIQSDIGNLLEGRETLKKAVSLSPNEAVFWEDLSSVSKNIAVSYSESGENALAAEYARLAIEESNKSMALSPANVNIKRTAADNYVNLSVIDPGYLGNARIILEDAVRQAPTEAKLLYNLALAYLRTNDVEAAVKTLEKTIEMKKDYSKAYYALALIYIDLGEKEKAKTYFEYILKNISPNDPVIKRELDELGI